MGRKTFGSGVVDSREEFYIREVLDFGKRRDMRTIVVEAEFYKPFPGSGVGIIKELAVQSSEGFSFHVMYAPPRGMIFPRWQHASYEYRKVHGIPWTMGKRPYTCAVFDLRRVVEMFSMYCDHIEVVTKGLEKASFFESILEMPVHDLGMTVPSVRELQPTQTKCKHHDFITPNCASFKASIWLDYLLYKRNTFM